MKMLIAILKDDDIEKVVQAMTADNFRVTRVASTGGFFHKGNTTLFVGMEDDKVDAAIGLIRANVAPSAQESHKNTTVFVVPVSRFEQI